MSRAGNGKRRVVVWPQGDVVRRVVLDGVEVVLERRAGVWAVADVDALASETALLETLGQPNDALGRARGVAAALNAHLVRPDQLSGLVRRLAWLWMRRSYGYWHLAFDERDALAAACAHLGGDAALEFLSWVLAKRLEPALWRTAWMPPGWHGWAGDAQWEFDRAVAQRLGEGFFETLAAHPDRRFRDVAVATDPVGDPRRLGELAADRDWRVRDLVAVNPSTPVDVLEGLSCGTVRDPEAMRVRLRVLQNPFAPAWLIAEAAVAPVEERFARQTSRWDIAGIAQRVWAVLHPRAPKTLLRDLAGCGDATVRAAVGRSARASARVLEALAPSLDTDVRAAVAANPSARACLLERLAGDSHRTVRAAVASNRATPAGMLVGLAGDSVAAVRREAARNEATPSGVLRALCEDSDVLAAAAAAANPATERSAMRAVAERIAVAGEWPAREIAAGLAETPGVLLGLLADDSVREVRVAVAANPRAPVRALRALSQRAETELDLEMLGALLDNDSLDTALRARTADAYTAHSGPPPQLYMSPADQRRWAQR